MTSGEVAIVVGLLMLCWISGYGMGQAVAWCRKIASVA